MIKRMFNITVSLLPLLQALKETQHLQTSSVAWKAAKVRKILASIPTTTWQTSLNLSYVLLTGYIYLFHLRVKS